MEKRNELRYSPNALDDLFEIWKYINNDLKNPSGAINTINAILESIDNLKMFSQTGSPLSTLIGYDSDYRFLVCGNYLAFYRADAHTVYIDRVLYGKRDYLRILFESDTEGE